jgi:site-specific DNA-cytosine methylase
MTAADGGLQRPRWRHDAGLHQNDFELLYRCGDLNLGAPIVEANRHIVGWEWKSHFTPHPSEWWVPENVDAVVGSPPCAGFSTMSSKEFRGIDSKANDHMKRFVAYAGRVAPAVVAFESVQQAFSQGRELMTRAPRQARADTGHKYDLYHVLHNNASVGGAAVRARYFWMASRIPFGVEYPVPDKVPTLMESIGDLQRLQMTWEKQPYRVPTRGGPAAVGLRRAWWTATSPRGRSTTCGSARCLAAVDDEWYAGRALSSRPSQAVLRAPRQAPRGVAGRGAVDSQEELRARLQPGQAVAPQQAGIRSDRSGARAGDPPDRAADVHLPRGDAHPGSPRRLAALAGAGLQAAGDLPGKGRAR